MKIVTIWNTYGPYHLARVKALENVFDDASVVCFSHCAGQDDYRFFNLQPQKHIVLVQKNAKDLRFFESLAAAFRSLRAERPDVVLTCGYERPETLASVVWCRMAGRQVFLMLDNQLDDHPRNFLVELIKRVYLRAFNGFIYGGDTHKDYLRHLNVPASHEVHGYNCVDNESIWQATLMARKANRPLFSENDYFLCVARLIPKKNLVRLMHAYAMYVEQCGSAMRPWSLLICGDGPERAGIETAIQALGLVGLVILVGRVDEFDDMVNYYAFARALVLASHENEQWGLVVNEAMASGLPVLVARQCGCASSLVKDGENGFTFDGTSVEPLAAHLQWLHEHADQLQRMGGRSREIIQEYSPENFAKNVLSLYRLNG